MACVKRRYRHCIGCYSINSRSKRGANIRVISLAAVVAACLRCEEVAFGKHAVALLSFHYNITGSDIVALIILGEHRVFVKVYILNRYVVVALRGFRNKAVDLRIVGTIARHRIALASLLCGAYGNCRLQFIAVNCFCRFCRECVCAGLCHIKIDGRVLITQNADNHIDEYNNGKKSGRKSRSCAAVLEFLALEKRRLLFFVPLLCCLFISTAFSFLFRLSCFRPFFAFCLLFSQSIGFFLFLLAALLRFFFLIHSVFPP